MEKILFFFAMFCCFENIAQPKTNFKNIIFEVEKLPPPSKLLLEKDKIDLLQSMEFVYEKTSPLPDKFAYWGNNPVLNGYINAYKEHRPIVINPDMIWLMICQGFAHHINNNAEQLRHKLVNFEGKHLISVTNPFIRYYEC